MSHKPIRYRLLPAAASRAICAPAMLAVALAGCGQKGPLYLPPPAQTTQQPSHQPDKTHPDVRKESR